MNKKDKKIVLKAMKYIENGVKEHSCPALSLAEFGLNYEVRNIRYIDSGLRVKYQDLFQLNNEYGIETYIDGYQYNLKEIRLLMLALFMEIG